jgi:hypothetical protein
MKQKYKRLFFLINKVLLVFLCASSALLRTSLRVLAVKFRTRAERSRSRGFVVTILIGLWLSSVAAGLQPALAQEFVTATPDAEGVIYVEVQPNDNLWTIAFRHGLTLPELLDLNGLSENALIRPGDRLIVGYGTPPATPTVPLPPTPTLPPPTPTVTPAPPPTAICLLAFVDLAGSGRFDPGDPLQEAVAFTIFNETAVVANYITDGFSEPFCIEGLPPGDYNVTRSLHSGEEATTPGDMAISLGWGDRVDLAFGAVNQRSLETVETAVPPAPEISPTPALNESATAAVPDAANRWGENGPAPWVWGLAACGFLLLAGLLTVGLVAYLYLTRAKTTKKSGSNRSK